MYSHTKASTSSRAPIRKTVDLDTSSLGEIPNPLILALKTEKLAIAKKLIKAGIDLDITIDEEPLLWYIQELKHYGDWNYNKEDKVSFHELIKIIALSENYHNVKSKNGTTVLMLAADQGYEDIVEHYVGLPDVDINAVNDLGYSALWLASMNYNTKIVEILIQSGAEIDSRPSDKRFTPLMYYCDIGNAHMVDLMLKNGANPNVVACFLENKIETPLNLSIKRDNSEIFDLLLGIE